MNPAAGLLREPIRCKILSRRFEKADLIGCAQNADCAGQPRRDVHYRMNSLH
jgi:hypothetical protein